MKQRRSVLQSEIKQRVPFRSSAEEGLLGVLRTADVLRRAAARIVGPHGITHQQYNVLRILRGAGEKGIPTLEIAGRMIEQAPGITRLLDRLEAKKLVRRKRCPEDRRQVLCWSTPEGLGLLASLDEPIRASQSALAKLARRDLEALIRILDKVRAAEAS